MGGMGYGDDDDDAQFFVGEKCVVEGSHGFFSGKQKHGVSVENWLVADGFKLVHLFSNPCFKTRGGSIKILFRDGKTTYPGNNDENLRK